MPTSVQPLAPQAPVAVRKSIDGRCMLKLLSSKLFPAVAFGAGSGKSHAALRIISLTFQNLMQCIEHSTKLCIPRHRSRPAAPCNGVPRCPRHTAYLCTIHPSRPSSFSAVQHAAACRWSAICAPPARQVSLQCHQRIKRAASAGKQQPSHNPTHPSKLVHPFTHCYGTHMQLANHDLRRKKGRHSNAAR